MNLAQFLSSLSIEGAGEHTFDMMVEEGYTTVKQINGMSIQQIADVGKISKKTIGEKTAKRIWDSLHSARAQELLQYADLWVKNELVEDIVVSMQDQVPFRDSLRIEVEDGKSELNINLLDKKVLFTGKGPFSRDALTSILKRNGAIIKSSIAKDLDILILADLNSTSNKAKKARKWGIKMVTYSDVFGD